MPTRVSFLAVALLVVLLPWLLWQMARLRRTAPLAVIQILVGILLGPSCLGRAAPELHRTLFSGPVIAALDGIATAGVLLYVFCTGLQLDMGPLRRDAGRLGAIVSGSILAPLVLGAGAGWWMIATYSDAMGPASDKGLFVAAVAICVAVTALPVLAAILAEMGLLRTQLGQTALALAALNDAAMWAMLAALLAVAGAGVVAGLIHLGLAGLWFAALASARPLLCRMEGLEHQALVGICVALAILSACVSEALGTGYLIGAFAAGVVIPVACRSVLLAQVELVTATVLLPFFFVSAGLKALIDPTSASFIEMTAVVTLATVLGKVVGTAFPARHYGIGWVDSMSLGIMMQTKGLMEVVVLSVLQQAGLIGGQVYSALVTMAVICTILTTPAVRFCQRIVDQPKIRGAGSD